MTLPELSELDVGVWQPRVEREHRHLTRSPDTTDERNPAQRRNAGADLREVERATSGMPNVSGCDRRTRPGRCRPA